jgi:hypothetical protein
VKSDDGGGHEDLDCDLLGIHKKDMCRGRAQNGLHTTGHLLFLSPQLLFVQKWGSRRLEEQEQNVSLKFFDKFLTSSPESMRLEVE